MKNLNIKATEQLLNERLQIAVMDVSSQADKSYLNGALAAVRMLGIDYFIRDGKITLIGGEDDE